MSGVGLRPVKGDVVTAFRYHIAFRPFHFVRAYILLDWF